jgi:16S rRNA (adenine1518-N6/adenine1519-N6)-dimethyltransferase
MTRERFRDRRPRSGAHPGRARKRFGQHFLEPAWVDKLIRAIDPAPDEAFLEIGPGRGALTLPLAAHAARVVACEIDRDLAADLQSRVPDNVQVLQGDFLTTPAASIRAAASSGGLAGTLRVAANLPYNVASPILFKLVDLYLDGTPLADAVVMLQREVADRLLAKPGTKEYGVLTVLLGHVAAIDRVFNLPPGAFRPAPRVQSSVVRLRFHAPDPPVRDRTVFSDLVRAVFTRRRKTLANALLAYTGGAPDQSAGLHLDLTRRPESLSVAEFARLSDVFPSP